MAWGVVRQMVERSVSRYSGEIRDAILAGPAVQGRSNRDIAQELFVSPKTVENHLGRVYSRLGIGNRRELAGALA